MIRPDTPPGAEIICIDAAEGPWGPIPLTLGAIYTVDRIIATIDGVWAVLLAEVEAPSVYAPPWGMVTIGFGLHRFRYLDLPDELTRLLDTTVRRAEPVRMARSQRAWVSRCSPSRRVVSRYCPIRRRGPGRAIQRRPSRRALRPSKAPESIAGSPIRSQSNEAITRSKRRVRAPRSRLGSTSNGLTPPFTEKFSEKSAARSWRQRQANPSSARSALRISST